jgi:D-cysteine desulfhydrase
MAPVSQRSAIATVLFVMPPSRIELARLPTPLERAERLEATWGGPAIWIKRDDLTGFGLSGNKVRKLEYHLAAAVEAGADTVITCGAVQSNHCRATALAAARLGLGCILYLRSPDGEPPEAVDGNHLLQRLAGAECHFITPQQYDRRNRVLATAADRVGRAWVIPEGASDALGMWGFATAAEELGTQLGEAGLSNVTLWHAASSAGTTAGLVWGAGRSGITDLHIVGCSVGEPADTVAEHVDAILADARDRYGGAATLPNYEITDEYVGGGYGIASPEELAVQAEASRLTGMLFDPTYTGKALFGLREEIRRGTLGADHTVVFWHTGGGFAVFAHNWTDIV